jgi:hypothetical protein
MSASNAALTPADIVLTPMRVTMGGVDLGGTEGGVHLSPKYKIAPIHEDQAGDTQLDGVVAGQHYTCKFVLAETKNKAHWKIAFPHAKLVGTAPNQLMYFDLQIGDKLSNHTQVVTLHPLAQVDGDLSQDITLYKAVAMSASEIKYGPDKQTGLSVELMILPDISVIPFKFLSYGDPTIGLVNAIAAAAVSGGGNVGNGVISAQAANNAYTKTETITVQCVGQTTGNDFSVSGSLSGALGEFHVAAANGSLFHFVSNPISFTFTQGTVQSAFGDSYTIATTAANYA